MDKYIGLIIKNQDDKILLYEDNYYIKMLVKDGDDIDLLISKKLIDVVEQSRYRIVKIYNNFVLYGHQEITMYLVEVGVFHNEFDFMDICELLDVLHNTPSRDFFEENFVRYDKYKGTVYSVLSLLTAILIFGDLYLSSHQILPRNSIVASIIGIIFMFAVVIRLLAPKLTYKIIKYNIDYRRINKIIDSTFFILAIVYFAKVFIIK